MVCVVALLRVKKLRLGPLKWEVKLACQARRYQALAWVVFACVWCHLADERHAAEGSENHAGKECFDAVGAAASGPSRSFLDPPHGVNERGNRARAVLPVEVYAGQARCPLLWTD